MEGNYGVQIFQKANAWQSLTDVPSKRPNLGGENLQFPLYTLPMFDQNILRKNVSQQIYWAQLFKANDVVNDLLKFTSSDTQIC